MTDVLERESATVPSPATSHATKPRRPRRSQSASRTVMATRRPLNEREMILTWATATLSFLALWLVFFALVLSHFTQAHAQATLYSKFREQLSLQIAPLGGAIVPGSPVAVMRVPALRMQSEVIVEGTAPGDLMSGPGHLRSTPLPGQAGTAVLYGRARTFGGPFARIAKLRAGDTITFTTGEGDGITYKVEGVRHAGDPQPAPLAAGAGRLTLVSAESGGWRNGFTARQTVYVDALLQGAALATPSGRPSRVPVPERAMKTDPGTLYVLVLWLALLVLTILAALWAQQRWGRLQTWLVGIPAAMAVLWGLTESAMALLPNLM